MRPRRCPRPPLALVALAASALAAPPLAAASLADRLPALVEQHAPQAIACRHDLHQHPELSYEEVQTGKRVAAELQKLGLEVKTGIAKTGVVGVLKGGRPGPVVAVRADMDALPVVEQSDFPFRSTVRTKYQGQDVGVAHACGHDIHTSVELGVASMLAAVRQELPGTVVFVFQPAEEGAPPGEATGARRMLDEKLFGELQPAAIFGLHSYPDLDVGEVGVTSGPTRAAVDRFRVTLHGKQSHGAAPQSSVDPIVMAAQAVLALQTIRSRNLDPLAPSVVTVGILRSGERFNIIPADAYLEGTVRSYGSDVEGTIEKRMREILDGISKAMGGSYEMAWDQTTPATVNSTALEPGVRQSLEAAMGQGRVHVLPPTMGGEDFAYFANVLPAFYFDLGTREPGGSTGGLHTPTFHAPDTAVTAGMRAMSRVLVDYLAQHGG
jgi:amidohydrolase